MALKEKTHGNCLAAVRAFLKNDPLLGEVTPVMIAQAALGALAAWAGLVPLGLIASASL